MLAALAGGEQAAAHLRARTVIAALVLFGSCRGGGEPEDVIDRETFIATYVDLRVAALSSPTGTLSDADRMRVLREHGVSEQELLAFAEARGGDPVYMTAVWEEVQARLAATPYAPDSSG